MYGTVASLACMHEPRMTLFYLTSTDMREFGSFTPQYGHSMFVAPVAAILFTCHVLVALCRCTYGMHEFGYPDGRTRGFHRPTVITFDLLDCRRNPHVSRMVCWNDVLHGDSSLAFCMLVVLHTRFVFVSFIFHSLVRDQAYVHCLARPPQSA